MTDSSDPVAVDGALAYRVTVNNLGDAEASAVTLTDTLPAGATFISASPSQGNCSPSGGTVACSLGALPAGSNAIVDIVVTPLSVGTITNTATVTASESEVCQDNNTAMESHDGDTAGRGRERQPAASRSPARAPRAESASPAT